MSRSCWSHGTAASRCAKTASAPANQAGIVSTQDVASSAIRSARAAAFATRGSPPLPKSPGCQAALTAARSRTRGSRR
jgi:hypothetical protein